MKAALISGRSLLQLALYALLLLGQIAQATAEDLVLHEDFRQRLPNSCSGKLQFYPVKLWLSLSKSTDINIYSQC